MNKNQSARIKRHGKVDRVLTDFTAAIAALPGIAAIVGAYRTLAAPLLPITQQQRLARNGFIAAFLPQAQKDAFLATVDAYFAQHAAAHGSAQ